MKKEDFDRIPRTFEPWFTDVYTIYNVWIYGRACDVGYQPENAAILKKYLSSLGMTYDCLVHIHRHGGVVLCRCRDDSKTCYGRIAQYKGVAGVLVRRFFVFGC
jgi:hypothetical protein